MWPVLRQWKWLQFINTFFVFKDSTSNFINLSDSLQVSHLTLSSPPCTSSLPSLDSLLWLYPQHFRLFLSFSAATERKTDNLLEYWLVACPSDCTVAWHIEKPFGSPHTPEGTDSLTHLKSLFYLLAMNNLLLCEKPPGGLLLCKTLSHQERGLETEPVSCLADRWFACLCHFFIQESKKSVIVSQTWISRAGMDLGWQSDGLAYTRL